MFERLSSLLQPAASRRRIDHEQRLEAIVAHAVDAILAVDAAARIDYWNEGAEALLGFRADEVVGRQLSELLGGGAAATAEAGWLVEIVGRKGSLRRHTTRCRRADGRMTEVELTATQLRDRDRADGMSLVLRDLGLPRRREAASQQLNVSLSRQAAERNQELATKILALARANEELRRLDQTRSEFVSQVSHQIRAPLTNIDGAVQRMQTDCPGANATCERMFLIIEEQIARLDRLVKDVLNAARLEAGEASVQLEPVSVMPLVRQLAEEIRARASTREIRIREKPGLPMVLADRDRVAEVLVNLLDNADKYSPPGEVIRIALRADQTTVTLSVRDAGPGVPSDELERIFDRFYRTDSSDAQAAYGYGLGLYVGRCLVEAQGGRIWAENHPDGGAVFAFTLPVWEAIDG